MEKYTKSQLFACNQWLSEWPDDMSYDSVIYELSRNKSWNDSRENDIYPWELIENMTGEQIAVLIDDTRVAFERALLED